jgi:hypothetical protein
MGAVLAGAVAAAALAVLILWRDGRREDAHVRHVDALMAEALAELRASRRGLLVEQFARIVTDDPDLLRAEFDQIVAGIDQ